MNATWNEAGSDLVGRLPLPGTDRAHSRDSRAIFILVSVLWLPTFYLVEVGLR
jgi:hypothetical protein